jgi:hypothetical protein
MHTQNARRSEAWPVTIDPRLMEARWGMRHSPEQRAARSLMSVDQGWSERHVGRSWMAWCNGGSGCGAGPSNGLIFGA